MINTAELWLVTRRNLHEALPGGSVDEVLDTLDEGEKRLVSVEADALASIVEPFFGQRSPPVAAKADEGSITRLFRFAGRTRLFSFNDTTGLERRPDAVTDALERRVPVVALIRHGQTAANVAGRWQGSMDDALDEEGERQANALFEWYGPLDSVWSSPLRRAAATATALHAGPSYHNDLVELRFGNWEGMTTDEIRAIGPLFDQIFIDGSDHPRGETGETWDLLERRMWKALEEINPSPGKITGIVTHGAAIRAVITSLTANGWAAATGLFTPPNTSVTHLVMSDPPVVADYGLAPHLERLRT
ncbi:MAG: histidine phosphatase family protein [Acidimicrobiia bacterium]